MPKLPVVSSRELIKALLKTGFEYAPKRGKGSHVALFKRTDDRTRQIIVPEKNEIPKGTLFSIFGSGRSFKGRPNHSFEEIKLRKDWGFFYFHFCYKLIKKRKRRATPS